MNDAERGPGFPRPEAEMTHILVVEDLERSRQWWVAILGASRTATMAARRPCSGSGQAGCCW